MPLTMINTGNQLLNAAMVTILLIYGSVQKYYTKTLKKNPTLDLLNCCRFQRRPALCPATWSLKMSSYCPALKTSSCRLALASRKTSSHHPALASKKISLPRRLALASRKTSLLCRPALASRKTLPPCHLALALRKMLLPCRPASAKASVLLRQSLCLSLSPCSQLHQC